MSSPDLATSLSTLLRRDLSCLRRALEAYPTEEMIWQLAPGISNSAGTLALHCCGNLQYYVGAVLGGTGYRRDREAEFNTRGLARSQLIQEIENTVRAIEETLPSLPHETLDGPYPLVFDTIRVQTADFLIHLAIHLGFHLGQVEYHRRLLTGSGATAGAMRIAELSSASGD